MEQSFFFLLKSKINDLLRNLFYFDLSKFGTY